MPMPGELQGLRPMPGLPPSQFSASLRGEPSRYPDCEGRHEPGHASLPAQRKIPCGSGQHASLSQ